MVLKSIYQIIFYQMLRHPLNDNDLTLTKKFTNDVIHGTVGLSYFATFIIETQIFQRLGGLKQLGPCRYIYQTATHTRYEHSIGTYALTGDILSTIAGLDNQHEIDMWLREVPELENYYERTRTTENLLTPYVRELVKIAGLCHDIGHACFSHLYDDSFLPKVDFSNNPNKFHEHRSNLLIDKIIREHPILSQHVTDSDIAFIKAIINPTKHQTGFIFQIVSNNVNGLDVDKFDYLQRDIKTVNFSAKIDTTMLTKYFKIINNTIVYPIEAFDPIENLFRTRHKMYKNVYLHPSVTSVEYLITEIMVELNKIMDLASSINDMDKFITLNDNTVIECPNVIEKLHVNLTEEQLMSYNKIKELKHRLDTQDFYQLLCSVTSKEKIRADELLDSLGVADKVIVASHKIGFLSGNKQNPFENIYFFNSTEMPMILGPITSKGYELPVLSSTGTHQEYVTNFYYNGQKDQSAISLIEKKLKSVLAIS